MPCNDPDPTDPMTLHGVGVETEDAGANRKMARCFIEEFCRMGFDRERLLHMFRKREYAGPFMAYQDLGEAEILTLIDEEIALRGPRRAPDTGGRVTDNEISLPILNR